MVDSPITKHLLVADACLTVMLYKCMKKKSTTCSLPEGRLRKILLVMTLKFFVLLLTFGTASAMGYAQEQKLNVVFHDEMLENVLEYLKENTDYEFVYRKEILGNTKVKNVELKDVTLREVLDQVLRQNGFDYEIVDQVIVIRKLPTVQQKKEIKIAGQVTDEQKNPMPGVTVMVKGLTIGTATDRNGKYVLRLPEVKDLTLIFSFIGMESKEVKYTGQDTINVVLRETVNEMDEVTVVSTGYQNVNRRDMVGSYTTVKAEDIMMPAYATIDQMLQGQVPGMMVLSSSTRAGTTPKIQIRGTSTLLGNQDPIWVVDGIIQDDPISLNASSNMTLDMKEIIGNQVSWLNPNDIETITVLKDASATAIYGSRASNGVIVITTKKGKTGRMSINYAGNFSIAPRPRYKNFNLMNSQERVQFSEDAFAAGLRYKFEPIKQINTYEGALKMFQSGEMTSDEFIKTRNYLETVNTDWLDLLTRTSFGHNHNVSVTGASDKVNYALSVGYNSNDGQEKGNSSERLTARAAVTLNMSDNIRVNLTLNGTTGTNKGFNGVDPLNYALTTSRSIAAFEEDGSYSYYRKRLEYKYNKEVESIGYNVLNELENTGSEVNTGSLKLSFDFQWKLLSWLTYQFTGGYSYNTTNSQSWALERSTAIASTYRGYDYGSVSAEHPWFSAALLPFGGTLFSSAATVTSYNVQNKLMFSKSFNENHRLNAMVAIEARSTKNKNDQNTRYGYVPDRGNLTVRPTLPEDFVPVGGGASLTGYGILEDLYNGRSTLSEKTDNFFSVFATLAYSLKNRYVFNFNVRNDASNRFGQNTNKRFDPTYSFGLSWRMTEEEFMRNQRVLTNVNLKATWGIQGNALTNLSPDLILNQNGVLGIFNEYYSSINSIPNPNLSWERTHSWNFGLDLQFFGKVNANIDYYIRRSNAIISKDIPFENGRDAMSVNGGIIYNEGIEFTVSFVPVNTKNFGINMSVNSSKNWNSGGKVDKEVADLGQFLNGTTERILKKGYPLGSMWSFDFAGLNPENGRAMFNRIMSKEEYNGDMTSFLKYSGQKDPYFTGGVNLNIRYRSFTLATSFSLLLGGVARLSSPYRDLDSGIYMPDAENNLNRDLLKRWKQPGDEAHTSIPGFVIGGKNYTMEIPVNSRYNLFTAYANSDALTVPRSFLRCRGLNLSWRLNNEMAQRIGLNSLTVTASVNNLFVIASKRYNGFDPEMPNRVMPKTYSVGINVGF